MRTCWQQERDAFPYLILLQRSRDTRILDIVPAAAQAAALLESKPNLVHEYAGEGALA